jgi:HSP20 family molecular chaperone IbpA
MKKDPRKWKELIAVPEMFSPDDVHVQEDGSYITIKATKEDEGCRGHMVHKVSIPRDVDRESLKTLWLNNDNALVLMGQRKNTNGIKHDSPRAIKNGKPHEGVVAKREQAKEQSDDSEDDWEMFPRLSTFFAEPFGYPSLFYPVRGKKRKMETDDNEKPQPIKKVPGPVESSTNNSTSEETAKEAEKKEEDVTTIVIDGRKDQDMKEEENKEDPLAKPFRLHVDVTGYLQDDVKVEVNERQVTVNGEHKEDQEERCFSRKFTLPDFVDAAHVKWHWDTPNSELIITAPLL